MVKILSGIGVYTTILPASSVRTLKRCTKYFLHGWRLAHGKQLRISNGITSNQSVKLWKFSPSMRMQLFKP